MCLPGTNICEQLPKIPLAQLLSYARQVTHGLFKNMKTQHASFKRFLLCLILNWFPLLVKFSHLTPRDFYIEWQINLFGYGTKDTVRLLIKLLYYSLIRELFLLLGAASSASPRSSLLFFSFLFLLPLFPSPLPTLFFPSLFLSLSCVSFLVSFSPFLPPFSPSLFPLIRYITFYKIGPENLILIYIEST